MLMFKIIENITSKRVQWMLLKTCHNTRPTVRQYSDNKICPPKIEKNEPKSKSNKFLLTMGALALLGGATVGYAKYDPEFRRVLISYMPFTEPTFEALDKISVSSLYSNTKQKILESFKREDTKSLTEKKGQIPEFKEYKAPPPIVPSLEKEVKKSQDSYSEIRVEKKHKDKADSEIDIVGDSKLKSDFNPKELADLEKLICQSATEAVNAYNKAVHVVLSYNQDIEYIIDEAVDQIEPEMWENIREKTRSKNECIKRAREKAEIASNELNRLKELISNQSFNGSPNTKDIILNNLSKVENDIDKAKNDLERELRQGNVSEKYWDKVQKARKNFTEELEILFPDVDLSKKKLSIKEEELDLFILHVYANVLFYQKELAKMETVLQNRVSDAIETAKRGGFEPLTVVQICEAVEQEKRRLSMCFQQQVLKLKNQAETELREQLKRQSQAFNDHLNEAIKIKQIEIERILSRKFDEQLEEERCKFKIQLSAMIGKLRGLEEGIKIRNDADMSSKQAQVLWSACQSLLRAIKAGCPGMPWKDQIRPLDPEVKAVMRAAAPNDELVTVVINALPKEAIERGVYPEDAIRERFLKVEKVARTVDLIPAEGAALPIHLLSYLQSLLLIKQASPIPQSELNDDRVDFKQLKTNDILQRARYWLDRGDFAQALKYMNLLKGAPRCVAKQWMNETRILLETQQAANTLLAHAASSGLMYL